jgi:hypothetical protein
LENGLMNESHPLQRIDQWKAQRLELHFDFAAAAHSHSEHFRVEELLGPAKQ